MADVVAVLACDKVMHLRAYPRIRDRPLRDREEPHAVELEDPISYAPAARGCRGHGALSRDRLMTAITGEH